MLKMLERQVAAHRAELAASALMALGALAVFYVRHFSANELYFGDSEVFAEAARHMANGANPYTDTAIAYRGGGLPFITAPMIAVLLGLFAALLGPGLYWLLVASHIVAIVGAPLLQARLFLGRAPGAVGFGYAAFFCGLGAFGVTTLVSGNFGASLHFAIIAALAHGLRSGRWGWFHVVIAAACLVKPPYAIFWIVPVMYNGWNWRAAGHAALAAVGVGLMFLISYLANPALFADWLASLDQQVAGTGDYGHSVYGLMAWRMFFIDHGYSFTPVLAHATVMGALLLFLLFDNTRGLRKVAALVVLAVLANPRMKEYDAAFAAIPVAALYIWALGPSGAVAQRGFAALGVAILYLVLIYADHAPLIGPFVYVIAMAGAVLSLAVNPTREPVRQALEFTSR